MAAKHPRICAVSLPSALYSLTYRAAERITDAQRVELEELLGELAGSEGSDDVARLMALDDRVHRFIYRCAADPYLEQTLGRYFNLSVRIWHPVLDRLPHLLGRVHEHEDALRAIADRDAEGARKIVAEHVATFGRRSARCCERDFD